MVAYLYLGLTYGGYPYLIRLLVLGQILLLYGILGSALYRMHLYRLAYGLTELRVYVTGADQWRGLPDWPPADRRERTWFLHGGGVLAHNCPDGGAAFKASGSVNETSALSARVELAYFRPADWDGRLASGDDFAASLAAGKQVFSSASAYDAAGPPQ